MWQQEDASRCTGCGHTRAESMDPATERSWSAKALRCFACEARATKFRWMTEGGGQTTGLYVIAELPRNGSEGQQ